MRKSGLNDIKKRNRQLILQLLMENGALSRIEIAQQTELSPSTVTTLVEGLVQDGLVVESGVTFSTGGRRRMALQLNGEYGAVAVLEILRAGARMHLYSMALEELACIPLDDHYNSGNDLLISATSALMDYFGADGLREHRLMGIGILYGGDQRPSDFNVMYSTSLSSASISLQEALVTQFKMPVLEETAASSTVTQVLAQEHQLATNSVHIALGRRSVLAALTLNGRQLELREGHQADLTGLVPGICAEHPQLTLGQGSGEEGAALQPAGQWWTKLAGQLAGVIGVLCTLFRLDVVFLSGEPARDASFMALLEQQVAARLKPEQPPRIEALPTDGADASGLLANRIRRRALGSV